MDREHILERIAETERHINLGEQHLARQRQIIAELERDGHDASQARHLLRTFEDTQALHAVDLERLYFELGQADEDG